MADLDLVVLGAGTGGYVAAIRAAQLGLRVAVVERGQLGGTCLHRGCIPSKTFLRSAEVFHTVNRAAEYGVNIAEAKLDWPAVLRRKDDIVRKLHAGIQSLLKHYDIQVHYGTGTLMAPSIFAPSGWVRVEAADGSAEKLESNHLIIATGSRPAQLGLAIDGRHILTSDEALNQPSLPRSAVIVGGGAIGMEWASMYSDLGVEVTVVEALPRILPGADYDVSAELTRLMEGRKIKVYTGTKIRPGTAVVHNGQVTVEIESADNSTALTAEQLLVSVGRLASTQGIGLENFEKIKVQDGLIATDEYGRTGQPGIYAIGDVAGGQLAHVAARQGIIAVEHMQGLEPVHLPKNQIPRCIYTRPEVASVGLTEAEARAQGYTVKVGKVPFRAVGKALVLGNADGFAKLVAAENTGELLGAHLIGPQVTDLISEAGLATILNATAWELSVTVHPHPTLAEIFGEAAMSAVGAAIHWIK